MKVKLLLKYTIPFFICFFVNLCSSTIFAYVLSNATVCEEVIGGKPTYSAVVFPSSVKSIYCYTSFKNIDKEGFIYHVWYFRDKLVSKVKLKIKPPNWATMSKVYIKDTDIGPWRVEILNESGKLIYVIRFSVVE